MSIAISKYIRRKNMNRRQLAPFILISANTDIISSLQPSLLISLGDTSQNVQFFRNPNCEPTKTTEPDVKAVIDPRKLSFKTVNEIQPTDLTQTHLSDSGLPREKSPIAFQHDLSLADFVPFSTSKMTFFDRTKFEKTDETSFLKQNYVN